MADSLNTGLSPQQVLTAFDRALNDYTDAEIDALLGAKQDSISDLAAIRSGAAAGATAVQPADMRTALAGKQDKISDLSEIRSGAAAGSTAVQPAEFEADQQRQDALEAEDRAALVQQVDGGAKNVFKNTAVSKTYQSVTFTVNDDGTVSLSGTAATAAGVLEMGTVTPPAGSYIVSGCPAGGSWSQGTNKYRIRVAKNDAWAGDDIGNGRTITVNGSDTISLQINSGVGVDTAGLVFKPMICTSADYKISPDFVPYRPSWQEMYDMIKALQSGS